MSPQSAPTVPGSQSVRHLISGDDDDTADNVDVVCHRRAVRPLPPPSDKSFTIDVEAPRRRGAALCLHGYTGTPWELRVVADDLATRCGLAGYAPVLPGHGDDPAALNHLGDDDWLDAAVTAFDHLDDLDPAVDGEAPRPRVVVGCSMGGLLALQVSLRRRVDVLVLYAPALRLFPVSALGIAAMTAGLWRLRPFVQKAGPGGDVGAADAARKNPSYKVMPTRGLATFFKLQRRTESVLSSVTTPLVTIHGTADGTIDPASSRIIAARVKSPVIEHHRLQHTRHLVGLDVDRDLASDLACAFVDRVLSAPPTTAPAASTRTAP